MSRTIRSSRPHSLRVWSSINQTRSMSQPSWSHSAGYLQPAALNSRFDVSLSLDRRPPSSTLSYRSMFFTFSIISKQVSLGGSFTTMYKVAFTFTVCVALWRIKHATSVWSSHNLPETASSTNQRLYKLISIKHCFCSCLCIFQCFIMTMHLFRHDIHLLPRSNANC